MKIIVNGEQLEVDVEALSFEEVVALAKEPISASVTYCRAAGPKSEGCLSVGQTVYLKDGTILNAIVTGNA